MIELAFTFPDLLRSLGVLFLIAIPVFLLLIVLVLRQTRDNWELSKIDVARRTPALKSIPNPKAHWKGKPDPWWNDPGEMEKLSNELKAVRFQEIGVFEHSDRETQIRLFAVPEHHAVAWLQENGDQPIDLTVCSWSHEGAPVRVTTVKSESNVVILPGERRKVSGDRSAKEMCRQLVELRQGLELEPINLENVVELMDREERARALCFAKDEESISIWGRQLKRTKVEDEERKERIPGSVMKRAFLYQMRDTIEECCLDQFAEESDYSAAEWARLRERFVVVHDRLSAEKMNELPVCESLTKEQHRNLEPYLCKEVRAREAFEAINHQLPPHARFREVGRVSEPVDATVYLAS